MVDGGTVMPDQNGNDVKPGLPTPAVPFDVGIRRADDGPLLLPGHSQFRLSEQVGLAGLDFGDNEYIPLFGDQVQFVAAKAPVGRQDLVSPLFQVGSSQLFAAFAQFMDV